jgi:hypothetical protein
LITSCNPYRFPATTAPLRMYRTPRWINCEHS